MLRRILSTLILITILSTSIIDVQAESDLTTKLKENLIPLKTTQAENGFEDLMPLKEILKDKKVIGMGEATHGTKEFFEMKHRMFEFLVEEMGYRVFAMESSFGGAQIVNDYILGIGGTLDEAIKATEFMPWSTQEVADMIEWMREYNENPKNETNVRFYGFDMQLIDSTLTYILEDLEKFHYMKYKKFEETLSNMEPVALFLPTPSDILVIEKSILEIKSFYEENMEEYISKTSQREFDLMIHNFDIVLQWLDFNQIPIEEDFTKAFNIRDKYMAENVSWILNFETEHHGNDKLMLWAHNLHICKSRDTLEGESEIRTFGSNLSSLFNDEYYSIGFDFYNGSFRSNPAGLTKRIITPHWANFTIDKSSENTLAYDLQETGVELGYLDFNNAIKDDDLYDLLSNETLMCNIGAGYHGKYLKSGYFVKVIPIETYDALIFVKTTEAAVGINEGPTDIQDGDEYLAEFYKRYLLMAVFWLAIISWAIIFIVRKKNKLKNM